MLIGYLFKRTVTMAECVGKRYIN